jgi:alpha-beta hydrolase superfamily lysophospholipase
VYQSILRTRDEALAQAAAIRPPIMLLCGTGDRIISVTHALRWYERLTCQKQVRTFPDSYHELHHEAVRDEVITCVRDWTLADG